MMKLHNPIGSFADIEEFLSVCISRLPALPASWQRKVMSALPVVGLALGSLLIAAAIVPFFGNIGSADPLAHSGLIQINVILFRVAFMIFGVILMGSYNLLKRGKLRGWYNIFYISIFHIFFVIVLFNIYSLLLLLTTWYVLFNVKKHFS